MTFKKLLMCFTGVQDFFSDVRTYYSVATDIWSGKPLKLFSRRELFIYKQVSCSTVFMSLLSGLVS